MALKFNPNPTFKLIADIAVPGQEKPETIPLTVKHLTPQDYTALITKVSDTVDQSKTDDERLNAMVDGLLSLIVGWQFADEKIELNQENMAHTVKNYPSFYRAVTHQYGLELYSVREKS